MDNRIIPSWGMGQPEFDDGNWVMMDMGKHPQGPHKNIHW